MIKDNHEEIRLLLRDFFDQDKTSLQKLRSYAFRGQYEDLKEWLA